MLEQLGLCRTYSETKLLFFFSCCGTCVFFIVPSSGPPNVTAVVLGPTNVNVSWGQVPKLDRNGLILGYTVGIV